MTCQGIQQHLLTDFLDHEIPSGQKAEVDRHLAACSSCRKFLAAVQRINDPLKALHAVEPGAHVWAGIRAQVEAGHPSMGEKIRGWCEEVLWGFRPTFVYGSWVAAMCVVLILPAGLYRQQVIAAADQEELVQLVYADDNITADMGADTIGTGTVVEAWL